MTAYVIVIEKTRTGYSAYSPDVPGCVATGRTRQAVERRMRSGLEQHLSLLRENGEPVPKPTSAAAYVTVVA